MSGTVSYHSGVAAEEAVARLYSRSGHRIAARRWRGAGGEIDLIATDGPATVFIEVKKADTHAQAAERLGSRQIGRIYDTASEYMGTLPEGQLSPVRFDVALVDATGRIEVLENAMH